MLLNKEAKNLDLKKPHVLLATWFGTGLIAKAPGTWGSLAAIPFALLICLTLSLKAFVAAIVILTILGYWSAARFEKETESHDNKMIVIDEVAGQWIALLPVFYMGEFGFLWIAFAFIMFRAFDIIKPWPVSWADKKLGGALGVMADDIIAGIMAATICLAGAYHYA